MARKTCQPSFDPKAGIGTDYALMATGIGAALIALIYLLLI
ncbi:MAG TPA: hypothetical protein VGZ92_10865 [Bradyrhizobium sp.]|jgi:hypothetical protein|nr:hypothetical protein [Bradyrhizobium sp.]